MCAGLQLVQVVHPFLDHGAAYHLPPRHSSDFVDSHKGRQKTGNYAGSLDVAGLLWISDWWR